MPPPFPGTFPGTISAPPDVARLLAEADAVCVADVADIRVVGSRSYSIDGAPYEFEVARASLGSQSADLTHSEDIEAIEFLRLDIPNALPLLEPHERAVAFLERRDGGYWLKDKLPIPIGPDERAALQALVEDSARASTIAAAILDAAGN
jgi:hypothetical protein